MKLHLCLALFCVCVITSCGGGMAGKMMGAPTATMSPDTLAFGTEVVGSMSQTLDTTLSNSGTATLNITSIVASTNFSQTNTCGSTLATGANCVITVTFAPTT